MPPRDAASPGSAPGDERADRARGVAAPTDGTVRVAAGVLLAALLVVAAVAVGTAVAVASHYDEAAYDAGEASDFTIHTYEGDDAEQRQPGAADRSYWTESIVYQIPEDEKLYLTESVTYRPMPADCAEGDIDVLGIDRGATHEGEREVDESVFSSVQSYSEDTDARDRYEREAGEYGDLSTADDVHVERIEVQWYGPDEIGTPVELYRGDRFVTAQSECFENPEAAGWYRWAAFNEGEYENGTEVTQAEPTFGHWYWICDCVDRQDAVETLGPPPSEQDAATPTDGGSGTTDEDGSTDGGTPDETDGSGDGDTDAGAGDGQGDGSSDPGSPTTPTTSDASGSTASGGSASSTPTPGWDDIKVRTPAAADGAGFSSVAAVVGLVVALAAIRFR